MRRFFGDRIHRVFRLSETQILITLAVIIGLGTGVGAYFFTWLIVTFKNIFFGYSESILAGQTGELKWWIPAIPLTGGLIVGPIVHKFAVEAKGHGVPEVMAAVARRGGIIRPRVAIAKIVASAICIGSGGSAGREGPIVQIGSAIGSTIGQLFKMSAERLKILVGCGAAAGISAVFNAPIAGVIFSLEVILGDFAIKTFSPVLISSVISSVVARAIWGNNPAFQVPDYSLVSVWEIPLYMVLGIVCGAVAVLFTQTLNHTENLFDKLKIHPWIKPALGGLLVGFIGIFYPQIFSDGYDTIRLTIYGRVAVSVTLILIFLKILATSLTLGSGSSGGIFAPSLFIGAVTGGTFGYAAHFLFPAITAGSGAYALVGMAALVGGTTHAPMTAILIIFEMTSDYRIILPLMVAVVFSTLVARRLFEPSIYTIKLIKRGIFLKAGKDTAILQGTKVSEVMSRDFASIAADMPIIKILETVEKSRGTDFAVIDRQGKFIGMLSLLDLMGVLSKHTLDNLIIAKDIVLTSLVTVSPEDTLEDANQKFAAKGYRMLPVVSKSDPSSILGVLHRADMMREYNRKLIETIKS